MHSVRANIPSSYSPIKDLSRSERSAERHNFGIGILCCLSQWQYFRKWLIRAFCFCLKLKQIEWELKLCAFHPLPPPCKAIERKHINLPHWRMKVGCGGFRDNVWQVISRSFDVHFKATMIYGCRDSREIKERQPEVTTRLLSIKESVAAIKALLEWSSQCDMWGEAPLPLSLPSWQVASQNTDIYFVSRRKRVFPLLSP